MNIEDTGNGFVFTEGSHDYFHPYGGLQITVNGSQMDFANSRSLKTIGQSDYEDITLVNIVGVSDATELAQYLMSK